MKYYIFEIWGGVEPCVLGKFKTSEEREEAAQKHIKSDDFDEAQDMIFFVDIDSKGNPRIGEFDLDRFTGRGGLDG